MHPKVAQMISSAVRSNGTGCSQGRYDQQHRGGLSGKRTAPVFRIHLPHQRNDLVGYAFQTSENSQLV